MKRLPVILLFAAFAFASRAEVKLPAVISDHMVLQRQASVAVWGWAAPGAKIAVGGSWDKRNWSGQADKDGRWLVRVRTPQAGGPYTLTVSDGTPVVVNDVMIGEVWVCSGQSNMVHPVRGSAAQPVEGSAEAIAESGRYRDAIRVFSVARIEAEQPQNDCTGAWKPADPANTPAFGAVPYFTALELYRKLGVPVGMVVSAWGSSRLEAWLSPESITRAGGVDPAALDASDKVQKQTSVLYNGMILPIKDYTARGFVWFQAGANRRDYQNYPAVLTELVRSWRALWGDPAMPFINIQGAMFPRDKGAEAITTTLIVEKQFEVRNSIPGYWVAVSTDVGGVDTPHYPQKGVTGDRVARLMCEHVYGMKGIKADAPDFEKVEFRGGKAIVTFSHAGDGLTVRGDKILAFTLSGADKKFYPAEARITGTNVVEVSCPEVSEPVALRYAFRNYTLVSLYDRHGLTPRIYRTDDWDDVY